MKELFNTISGSKLYGTNTPESDTDYKTVFLPDIKELLVGKGVKNIANTTGDDMSKNSKDDTDHEYIPIQVLAKDFLKGQTYALEVVYSALTSNPSDEIEILDPNFLLFASELDRNFLTSNIKAMLGYAYGQTHKYGIKGLRYKSILKFNDIVHDIVHNIEAINNFNINTDIDVYLKDTKISQEVEINKDKYLYMTEYEGQYGMEPAISLIGKIYPMTIKISEAKKRTIHLVESYGSRTKKSMEDGGIDWKAVSHAMRITYQAIDILKNKRLKFPLDCDRIKLLKEIKQGKYKWIEVEDMISNLMDIVDAEQQQTTLKELTQETRDNFDSWLQNWMYKFYGLEELDNANI